MKYSAVAQEAYSLFAVHRALLFRVEMSIEEFMTTQELKPWLKLAEWLQKKGVSSPVIYLRAMHYLNTPVTSWSNPASYTQFQGFYDKQEPTAQIDASAQRIIEMACQLGIGTHQVFESITKLPRREALGLFLDELIKRRLSPWLLMFSPKFKAFCGTLSSSEAEQLAIHLNPARRFEDFPEAHLEAIEIVQLLGI